MAGHADQVSSSKIGVLDVETTGLDIRYDRIIQIACLVINEDGKPLKLFETYFNPGEDGSRMNQNGSFKIHKISHDFLKDKPCFAEKAEEIISLLEEIDIVVGHNVAFDWGILRHEFVRLSDGEQRKNQLEGKHHEKDRRSSIENFDSLKFCLADTFRMALMAYNDVPSYSLSVLCGAFPIRVRKCQTVSYKWRCETEFDENTLEVQDKSEQLHQHNAITDVFVTAQLFKNCLKTLQMEYRDIHECKFPEYLVNKSMMIEVERLMKKTTSDQELIQLAKLSPDHMNVNYPNRGSKLRNMTSENLQKVIDFLSSKQSYSFQITAMICKAFKCAVDYQSELLSVDANVTQGESLFPELRFTDIDEKLNQKNFAEGTKPCTNDGCSPAKIPKTTRSKEETANSSRKACMNHKITENTLFSNGEHFDGKSKMECMSNASSQMGIQNVLLEGGGSTEDLSQDLSSSGFASSQSSMGSFSQSILGAEENVVVKELHEDSEVYPICHVKQDNAESKTGKEKEKRNGTVLKLSPVF